VSGDGVDYDGNGHVDLRHSPDVLASTANLLKTNGWRACAPFGEGTANFEVMREWNRSVVYRKTLALFSEWAHVPLSRSLPRPHTSAIPTPPRHGGACSDCRRGRRVQGAIDRRTWLAQPKSAALR
jgi:Transglycosylase SLT domain